MTAQSQTLEPILAPRRDLEKELTEQNRRAHTIYGFTTATSLALVLLVLLTTLDITPYSRREERRTIPIELLQFGAGKGSTSGGNLAEEGVATNAAPAAEPLADARVPRKAPATATATSKRSAAEPARNQAVREFANNAVPRPAREVVTSPVAPALSLSQSKQPQQTETAAAKTSEESGSLRGKLLADAGGGIGVYDGGDGGGLGRFGSGAGRGAGYGLEWGGGGNRVALHKELPRYPSGVNTSAQIKIRFTVLPNGGVGIAMPMQKGEPALERAAIEALRRWQFNPTNDPKEMVGFITFTFRMQ